MTEKGDFSAEKYAISQPEETSFVQDPEREEFVPSQHGRIYTGCVKLLNQEFKYSFEKCLKLFLNFTRIDFVMVISGLGNYLLCDTSLQLLKVVLTFRGRKSQHKGWSNNAIRSSTKLISFMLFMTNFTAVQSIKAEVVEAPVSVNTTLATHSAVDMYCEVEAEIVSFSVDNENADQDSVRDKGIFLGSIQSDGGFSRVNLTITVIKALNNTMVKCVAVNVFDNPSSSTSDPAYLTIEGMLPQPENFSVYFNNMQSSELLVNWSAPPTRFNTIVNGYNISSSLPETKVPPFTTKTQISHQVTNIDPCEEINITVTPFNGLEGDPAEMNGIYLPSPSSNISTELFVNVSELEDSNRVQIIFVIDITHLCPGSVPTHIKVVIQHLNDELLVDGYKSELRNSSEKDNKLISIKEIELNKSIEYKAIIEFNNRFGSAGSNQSFNFMINSTLNTIANSSAGSGGLNSTAEEPTDLVSTTKPPTSVAMLEIVIAVSSVMITTLLLIIVVMIFLMYCKISNRNSVDLRDSCSIHHYD